MALPPGQIYDQFDPQNHNRNFDANDYHHKHHRGKAREQLGDQADPILRKGHRNDLMYDNIQGDGKNQIRANMLALGLTSAFVVVYAIVMITWFYFYVTSFTTTLFVLFLLVCVSIFFMLHDRLKLGRRSRVWMFWLGLICLEASLVSTVVGFRCYFQHLVYYYRYQEMRPYTNVGASQPGSTFNDGSMFLFTEDTRIDPLRSVGFHSQWTGQLYCAAPIVDSTMSNANDIFYWAVGENCCLPRSEYDCDDAQEPGVRSALVVLEPEDIVRPFMQWAVAGAVYPRFEKAIKLQQATYYTKAASKIKLVYWSKDPVSMKNKFFSAAVGHAWKMGLIFAVLFLVECWCISTYFIYGKSKHPAEKLPLRDSRTVEDKAFQ